MELVLIICLATAAGTCEERHLSVAVEPVPQSACMVRAMPFLAAWAGDHPKWVIKRWRCTTAGGDGKRA